MDFDHLSGEAADVAYVFQVVREDHDSEGAGHLIFTEVDEVDASGSDFHAQDFAYHTFGFADVLAGGLNREAVGGEGCGREEQDGERCERICRYS